MLSITVDWLAFTYKETTHASKSWIDLYSDNKTSIPATPRNGYTSAVTEANGIYRSWNDDRPEMGHHVVVSGSVLRNVCGNSGLSQKAIIQQVVNSGASITRLDLATDAKDEFIFLSTIWDALEAGDNKGSARKLARMQGSDGGQTIYVGSRESEKFIRIYDKAIESGNDAVLWFRFEVELKGMVARAVALSLAKQENWKAVFDGVVLPMLSLPECSSYQSFFPIGDIPIGVPKIERTSNTERWIETQVTPAVAKWYIEHPLSEAVITLINTLNYLKDRQ